MQTENNTHEENGKEKENRCNQYIAVFATTLNLVTCGMIYGWPTIALPKLVENEEAGKLSLHLYQASYLAVLPLIGAAAGAIIAGYALNKTGRKFLIQLTALPSVIGWILVALTTSIDLLYIGRFLGGVADGIIFTVVPIFIGEISSPSIRGRLGSIITIALMVGILLINCLGFYVSLSLASFTAIIFPIISCFLLFLVPDSPYEYIIRKRFSDAKDSLMAYRGKENKYILEEYQLIYEAVEKDQSESKGSFKDLIFVPSNRRAFFVMLILYGSQQFSGITAVTFYISIIIDEANLGISFQTGTVIFFFVELVATAISLYFVDWRGRRFLLIVSSAGCLISLLALGFTLHFNLSSENYESAGILPFIFFIIYIVAFSIGLQSIPVFMIGEIFPTNVKNIALTVSELYFDLVTTLISGFFPIVAQHFGIAGSFYLLALLTLIFLVLIILYVPETKGISLEEIQTLLKQESETPKNYSKILSGEEE